MSESCANGLYFFFSSSFFFLSRLYCNLAVSASGVAQPTSTRAHFVDRMAAASVRAAERLCKRASGGPLRSDVEIHETQQCTFPSRPQKNAILQANHRPHTSTTPSPKSPTTVTTVIRHRSPLSYTKFSLPFSFMKRLARPMIEPAYCKVQPKRNQKRSLHWPVPHGLLACSLAFI